MDDINLIKRLIDDKMTMVTHDRFEYILKHLDHISNLPGDVVECGVWRGGMSIFLSKSFPKKKIWVCDSYEGCQNPAEGKYKYNRERHTLGMYSISLEEVKNNFNKYNALDENRVKFLKGWVRDTLKPEVCDIKEISLLRVDVDSYSATLEVLDYLYDKVVPGGMIVFDDSCLHESHAAMMHFFKEKDITQVYSPGNLEMNIFTTPNMPCGVYLFKK